VSTKLAHLFWGDKIRPDNVHNGIVSENPGHESGPKTTGEVAHQQQSPDGFFGIRLGGNFTPQTARWLLRTQYVVSFRTCKRVELKLRLIWMVCELIPLIWDELGFWSFKVSLDGV
jgi:hypothetical protein